MFTFFIIVNIDDMLTLSYVFWGLISIIVNIIEMMWTPMYRIPHTYVVRKYYICILKKQTISKKKLTTTNEFN